MIYHHFLSHIQLIQPYVELNLVFFFFFFGGGGVVGGVREGGEETN